MHSIWKTDSPVVNNVLIYHIRCVLSQTATPIHGDAREKGVLHFQAKRNFCSNFHNCLQSLIKCTRYNQLCWFTRHAYNWNSAGYLALQQQYHKHSFLPLPLAGQSESTCWGHACDCPEMLIRVLNHLLIAEKLVASLIASTHRYKQHKCWTLLSYRSWQRVQT